MKQMSLNLLQISTSGPNAVYFVEEAVLNRVPGLLLILASIYLVMGLLGSLMICQPPEDWIRRTSLPTSELLELNSDIEKPQEKNALMTDQDSDSDTFIHWKDALKTKEFYLLWITRLSVVLITQVIEFLNLSMINYDYYDSFIFRSLLPCTKLLVKLLFTTTTFCPLWAQFAPFSIALAA